MNSIITTATGNSTLTMSSREIARLTGKRHDNVVRDIEKMLNDVGINRLKFEGVYLDAKGEDRKCYNLPQDLTYTLVAGYRSDLRLKIVRRWMELEGSPETRATPKPKRPRKPPVLTTFKTGYGIAKTLGLDDNQAASHAGRYCLNKCGENPLPALGLDSRPTPTKVNYYNVTELGKELGVSGQAMNKLLIEHGYQVKVHGGSSSAPYEPTEKGKPHARLFDEVRKGSRGSQQVLKWKHVIVSLLHPFTKTSA